MELAFTAPAQLSKPTQLTTLRLPHVEAVASNEPPSSSSIASIAVAAATVGSVVRSRAARRSRPSSRHQRGAKTLRAAGKQIETFLVPGPVDASKLAMAVAPLAGYMDMKCLTFFSLGVAPDVIASVAGGSLGIHGMCPVYIADCYGIIGWDKKAGKNVELMEAGRGKEYGMAGGQGGQGVVVVAFRGKQHAATEAVNSNDGLHMVVATHGKVDLSACSAGSSWGGYAKACFKLEHSGDVVAIDQFVVSTQTPSKVVSFDGDAEKATATVSTGLSEKPTAVGYIPCFCRGFNKYGKDNVEPDAIAASGLKNVPLFGMFAHGELGPSKDKVVELAADGKASASHEVHSMTSVMALYGS
jgi:hypothetical protein